MRAKVFITFTDQTSEEELSKHRVDADMLAELYYRSFENIIESFKIDDVKIDLEVRVDDNTKESKQ